MDKDSGGGLNVGGGGGQGRGEQWGKMGTTVIEQQQKTMQKNEKCFIPFFGLLAITVCAGVCVCVPMAFGVQYAFLTAHRLPSISVIKLDI